MPILLSYARRLSKLIMSLKVSSNDEKVADKIPKDSLKWTEVS